MKENNFRYTVKVYRCDRCGAEGKEIHEKEDGEQEDRSLLRKLLDINRTAVEYLTPFAFGVTCVSLCILGDAVDQQTPAVLEPPSSLPEWSGKILMWGSIVLVGIILIYVLEQALSELRKRK